MAVEISREDDTIRIIQRRGRGWGISLVLVGIFFGVISFLFGAFGEHLPGLSVLVTCLWAFLLSFVCSILGVALTENGEHFLFSSKGLEAQFFRMRFVQWKIDYPVQILQQIRVEPQQKFSAYRVVLGVKGRADVELARNLNSEAAWKLASIASEMNFLPIEGS